MYLTNMQKRVRKNPDFVCPKKPKLDIVSNCSLGINEINTGLTQIVKSVNNKSLANASGSPECSVYNEKNVLEKHLELNSTAEGIESQTIDVSDCLNKSCKNDLDSNVQCLVENSEVSKRILTSSNVSMRNSSDSFQNSISLEEHKSKNVDSHHFSRLQVENDVESNASLNYDKKMSDVTENASADADRSLPDANNTKDSSDVKRTSESVYGNRKNTTEFQILKCNPSKHISNSNNMFSSETPNLNDKRVQSEQGTAKVSLGNTTISVPLLKPLNLSRILKNENIVGKVINIRGKKIKASPAIVQLSQVHLNPKSNTKIVQATLVGNKVQLPSVDLKPITNYTKANLTQTTQSSTVAVSSLPRQEVEDEGIFSENNPQSQNKNVIDRNFRPTDNSSLNVISNKDVPRSVSYPIQPAQLRLIDKTPTNITKSSDNIATDFVSNSITVTSSSDINNSKISLSSSKVTRKPFILSKTTSGPENLDSELNDIYLARDNHNISENSTLGKILEENILRKQIALAVQNGNRFQLKVTKCTDETKIRRNEPTSDNIGIQQQRKTASNLSVTETNPPHDIVQITNIDRSEKQNIKSEETQNVLLKHLLQSSSNQRGNSSCNQTLAPRKLAPVRAPSLGVVSSLEAQLARPVIPPVSSVGDMKAELSGKNVNEKAKKNIADNTNARGRFELISRETSFLSTIAQRQDNSETIQEPDKSNDSQKNNPAVNIEHKAVQFQSTKSNSNLFKSVSQNEMEAGHFRTVERDNNQYKSQAQVNNYVCQTTANNECNEAANDTNVSSVKPNMVKLDIEQNIELRKKIKRDYQKHKRQLLLNKDSLNCQRKKSRKVSKASEDYDEFIENKVIQMKQMFVLEVLEPLLNTFLGICSLYGYSDKVRTHFEHSYQHACKDDFGRTNLKNLNDFYSIKPYGSLPSKFNKLAAFQNKFYDEEFPAINNENCDKLFQLISVLKQQHIQGTDNISYTSNSDWEDIRNSISLNTSYPGIQFSNYITLNTDRMSPIIPFIKPDCFGTIKRKKSGQSSYKKCVYGSIETAVILTLSSFVAENILDIMKDLKSLIKSYSPEPNVLNNEKLNNINKKNLYISRIKKLQKSESTNIQNILNGTYKYCRNCQLVIICDIAGIDSNLYIRKKCQADKNNCENCTQYKKKNRKYFISQTQKKERIYEKSNVNKYKHSIERHFCTPNYKVFSPNCFWKPSFKDVSADDIDGICLKVRIAITSNTIKDIRRCVLCKQKGDSFAEGSSRLLNYDVNKWVHLNCALWSNNVYETINGGLMNLEIAIQQGLHQMCKFCNQYGASLKCFKMRCGHTYHLPCAIKEQCVFYKNKTIHCASHAHRLEKKNELSSVRVRRRVYIERDENRQVAAVMHHLELSNLLRIGNLTLINVGQLLPHQLEAFHTPNYIYPIGYKIIRFFWSTKNLNKRCRYICSIAETNNRPEFIIQIQEQQENDIELRDITPKAVWQRVLEKIAMLRKKQAVVQLFSEFFTGEDLFGLSEPSIVKILESLPGVESLTDYRFKYGRNPLLELPLALNPSGSARTEPKQRHNMNWKKTHTQRTSSVNLKLSLSPSSLVAGEVACPYSKQFVHSKSSQYRKMKQEWRNNVYLARSKIQGLGLYAARDLEKHTMVIEYIGQVIRTEVSELREKQYDLRNRGIYMFRLDEERVVDATLSGGLARYINHSCNPNCVTEIVDVDREYRIIIFAKRRINKGEELSYDYKFDIEDDAHKISCMCDAPNCRKWMN